MNPENEANISVEEEEVARRFNNSSRVPEKKDDTILSQGEAQVTAEGQRDDKLVEAEEGVETVIDGEKETKTEHETNVESVLSDPTLLNKAVDGDPEAAREIVNGVSQQLKNDPALDTETRGILMKLNDLFQKHKLALALTGTLLISASSSVFRRNVEEKFDAGMETGGRIVSLVKDKAVTSYNSIERGMDNAGLLWKESDYQPKNKDSVTIPSYFVPIEIRSVSGVDKNATAEQLRNNGIITSEFKVTQEDYSYRINYSPIVEWKNNHPEIKTITIKSIDNKLVSVDFEHYGITAKAELELSLNDGTNKYSTGSANVEKIRNPFDSKIDAKMYQLLNRVTGYESEKAKDGRNDYIIGATESVATTIAMLNALESYDNAAQ